MRRPALLVALLGAAAVVVTRRRRAQRSDADLWNVAPVAPDLR